LTPKAKRIEILTLAVCVSAQSNAIQKHHGNMMLTGAIGIAAGACSTTAYLPQVIKAFRTRSTGDISLAMFSIMAAGAALWLTYGILISDWPVIATNAASLGLMSIILGLKIRYG
jgi:MtN3 and saliva related transmembrane protein